MHLYTNYFFFVSGRDFFRRLAKGGGVHDIGDLHPAEVVHRHDTQHDIRVCDSAGVSCTTYRQKKSKVKIVSVIDSPSQANQVKTMDPSESEPGPSHSPPVREATPEVIVETDEESIVNTENFSTLETGPGDKKILVDQADLVNPDQDLVMVNPTTLADFLESPPGVCVAITSIMVFYVLTTQLIYRTLVAANAPLPIVAAVAEITFFPRRFFDVARQGIKLCVDKLRHSAASSSTADSTDNPESIPMANLPSAPSPTQSLVSSDTEDAPRLTRSASHKKKVEIEQETEAQTIEGCSIYFNVSYQAAQFCVTHNILRPDSFYEDSCTLVDAILNEDIYNVDVYDENCARARMVMEVSTFCDFS